MNRKILHRYLKIEQYEHNKKNSYELRSSGRESSSCSISGYSIIMTNIFVDEMGSHKDAINPEQLTECVYIGI